MINLKLSEKYEIHTLLPGKGDMLTIGIIKEIQAKIAVSPEDVKKYDVRTISKEAIGWNEEGKKANFDIDFTEPELTLLRQEIKKLDEQRSIPVHMYELCKKLQIG